MIHKTAIIDKNAKISNNVNIGPYCVVEENCIGFSGFIESLLNESSIGGDLKKKILIPKNLAFQKINNLQKKGYVTFQAIKSLSKKQFINHAKKQKCSFYFFDNTIYKTK